MKPKRNARESERDTRIESEVIVDCYNEYEVWSGWLCYLDDHLKFPFQAECVRPRKSSPLTRGERVTIIGMCDDARDELQEMKVRVKWQGRTLSIPLAQLEPFDVDAETEEAVADWHYWVKQGLLF
jgi:hypothetical protein